MQLWRSSKLTDCAAQTARSRALMQTSWTTNPGESCLGCARPGEFTVAAATAALGVLTLMPCVPVIPALGSRLTDSFDGNMPTLNNNCKLCARRSDQIVNPDKTLMVP